MTKNLFLALLCAIGMILNSACETPLPTGDVRDEIAGEYEAAVTASERTCAPWSYLPELDDQVSVMVNPVTEEIFDLSYRLRSNVSLDAYEVAVSPSGEFEHSFTLLFEDAESLVTVSGMLRPDELTSTLLVVIQAGDGSEHCRISASLAGPHCVNEECASAP